MVKSQPKGTVRGTLSPASIAASALKLGDQEGPEAMAIRRIAAQLGCDPMALYRHFANRVALLDAVADLALADLALPDDHDPWEDRLRSLLTETRRAALAHPGIAPHIAARPPLGPHGLRIGRVLIEALRQAGLDDRQTVAASQVLIAYLSSAIAMAVATQGRRDDRWSEAAQAVRDSSEHRLPADAMPAVGSVDQFSFGLDLLIDGLRARVRDRPR
ncbi:TetR/AcrR family transcriptional regulator [Microlunatus sp. GCM10028923]|uniref:TetR/AcrR family transcriptional regulator n=1 Tax=Microlunatus sp. GCM10028923 TaxID=3273400 RepID=UPI0036122A28